ncbi:hypothetical protein D3C76_1314480 [compost metagenome]
MATVSIGSRGNVGFLLQRMALSDHRDKSVAEQRLQANLRPHIPQNADFQINPSLTQMAGAFFRFGRKTESHQRGCRCHGGDQCGAECFDKALVGAQGKCAFQR